MKILRANSKGVLFQKDGIVTHLTKSQVEKIFRAVAPPAPPTMPVKEETAFRLYWLDGTSTVVKGNNFSEALNNNGYGIGSIDALDFYTEKEDAEYLFNYETKEWVIIDLK